MKNRKIFFLIEHQTKIDYTMPLRMLEYEIAIIESAIDKRKLGRKDYLFPLVIPIVLYSGNKKWNVQQYMEDVQEKLEGYEDTSLARYNIVDVNDFNEEELLKEESFLSKALLIEKATYTAKLAIYLEKIVKEMNQKETIYTKDNKELLITVIHLVLRKKLENHQTENLIQELMKEDREMLAVLEMIDRENKRLIAKGKKTEKLETARKMLKKGISKETIIEITELTEEEIRKIANEIPKRIRYIP